MNDYTATPTKSVKLQEARAYAAKQHEGQIYKPDLPYTTHLNAVENQLRRFGVHEDNGPQDEELLIAAQFHDVLEDVKRPAEELRAEISAYGESVLGIVEAVTDKPGANRKERHQNTYPVLAQNKQAVKVKLADRLANLSRGLEEGKGKGEMYLKEDQYFRETLQTLGEATEMWQEYNKVLGEVQAGLAKARLIK